MFESDSESSYEEEDEDDIMGRERFEHRLYILWFEISNLATVPDLLGKGDNNEDEVDYSGSEQQMDEEDKLYLILFFLIFFNL